MRRSGMLMGPPVHGLILFLYQGGGQAARLDAVGAVGDQQHRRVFGSDTAAYLP